MKYKIILANGEKIETTRASNTRNSILGFLILRLTNTTPGGIYDKYSNPEYTKEIKVIRFVDKPVIVTETDGSQHIEITWEQDPKVKIYHGYTNIMSLARVKEEENCWDVTLTSDTPDPEIVLEIYNDDDRQTE